MSITITTISKYNIESTYAPPNPPNPVLTVGAVKDDENDEGVSVLPNPPNELNYRNYNSNDYSNNRDNRNFNGNHELKISIDIKNKLFVSFLLCTNSGMTRWRSRGVPN